MKKQIRPNVMAIARKFPAVSFSPGETEETTRFSATELCLLSRRGLWHLLFFLLISIAAFAGQDFDLFAAVSEDFWTLLGSPPPPQLTHLVLGIYTFCALMLLPARLTRASLTQSWAHLSYRVVFYLFYLSANALAANFLVVFIAGLILYGLEQSYLLLHMSKTLHGAGPQIKQSK
ncbi:MAG: hypothetical protein EHM38_05550 [Geobacteraceae bacterium]|nr:MAG: hypothetical protein EHM38_05550 [Geobacteraceae bacterium]